MPDSQRPQWQLPTGVSRGTWEYAHTDGIADDYDAYFAHTGLFELDGEVIRRHFATPGLVADLGCGTARALVPLARRGFRGLAIDLSEPMLRVVRRKADAEGLDITCLQANLVELDGVADDSVDYCLSLFSTLGMIRGRENRQKSLRHARRILRPGGKFVLHVHNYWYNLYDPGGPWWVFKTYFKSLVSRGFERGDKYFFYRGVNNMFLHVFTYGELARDLREAGFTICETIHLDPVRRGTLRHAWLMGNWRANGWIVVCQ
jgi:SAM-dependent methyltransferase